MFISVGVVLLAVNKTAHEISVVYKIPQNTVDDVEIAIDQDMTGPVYIYYELDNFYQNHRRYVKSREDKQLLGASVLTSEGALSNCDAALKDENSGLILYPCGLIARSVFSDTFVFFHQEGGKMDVNMDSDRIAWQTDVDHKFRNYNLEQIAANQEKLRMWIYERFPVQVCEPVSLGAPKLPVSVKTKNVGTSEIADCDFGKKTCTFVQKDSLADFVCDGSWEKKTRRDWGVESGHFINWMRTAGLPKFRKLYGVIDQQSLNKGDIVTVRVQSEFDVESFGGSKRIVLATVTALGGQNFFLAVGYLVVGTLSLVFALLFTVRHRLGGAKNIKHLD